MLNSSNFSVSYSSDNPIYGLQILCVFPEYFNLFFLSCSLYAMYRGVEISHPLYAVLFLNLIIPLMTTVLHITIFFFISTSRYFLISNPINILSVFFHCTSWCVTSALRFVYIIYGDWFDTFIPSQKLQWISAVTMTCALTIILTIPSLSVAIVYGKQQFLFHFLYLIVRYIFGHYFGICWRFYVII